MVQVLYVQIQEPKTHESHITEVRWYNPQTGDMNTASVAAMVDFINNGGRAYVCDGSRITPVEVVVSPTKSYIRTNADASRTDNLLHLPKY